MELQQLQIILYPRVVSDQVHGVKVFHGSEVLPVHQQAVHERRAWRLTIASHELWNQEAAPRVLTI